MRGLFPLTLNTGPTLAMGQTVYAKSRQQWEALSLDGLRLYLQRANGSPCGKHLQQTELQQHCSC